MICLIDTERVPQQPLDRSAAAILTNRQVSGERGAWQQCELCNAWADDLQLEYILKAHLVQAAEWGPTIRVELRTRYPCFTCPGGCKQQQQDNISACSSEPAAADADGQFDEHSLQVSPSHVQAVYLLQGSSGASNLAGTVKCFVVHCPDCSQDSPLLTNQQQVQQYIQQHTTTTSSSSSSQQCPTLHACLQAGFYNSPEAFGCSSSNNPVMQPAVEERVQQLLALVVARAALHVVQATRPPPTPGTPAARAAAQLDEGPEPGSSSPAAAAAAAAAVLLPWRQWAAECLSTDHELLTSITASLARPSLETLQRQQQRRRRQQQEQSCNDSLLDMVWAPPYIAAAEHEAGMTTEKLAALLTREQQKQQQRGARVPVAAAAAPTAWPAGAAGVAAAAAAAEQLLTRLLAVDPLFSHMPAQQRVHHFLALAGISSISYVAAAMTYPYVKMHLMVCGRCGKEQHRSRRDTGIGGGMHKCQHCCISTCVACIILQEQAAAGTAAAAGSSAAAALRRLCMWCRRHQDTAHLMLPPANRRKQHQQQRQQRQQQSQVLTGTLTGGCNAAAAAPARSTAGATACPGCVVGHNMLVPQQEKRGYEVGCQKVQRNSPAAVGLPAALGPVDMPVLLPPPNKAGLAALSKWIGGGQQQQQQQPVVPSMCGATACSATGTAVLPGFLGNSIQPRAVQQHLQNHHQQQQQQQQHKRPADEVDLQLPHPPCKRPCDQQQQQHSGGGSPLAASRQRPAAPYLGGISSSGIDPASSAAVGTAVAVTPPAAASAAAAAAACDAADGTPPAQSDLLKCASGDVDLSGASAAPAAHVAAAAAAAAAVGVVPAASAVRGTPAQQGRQQEQQQEQQQAATGKLPAMALPSVGATKLETHEDFSGSHEQEQEDDKELQHIAAAAAAAAAAATAAAVASALAAAGTATGQVATKAAVRQLECQINSSLLQLRLAMPHQKLLERMQARKQRLAKNFWDNGDGGDVVGLQVLWRVISGLQELAQHSQRQLLLQLLGQEVPERFYLGLPDRYRPRSSRVSSDGAAAVAQASRSSGFTVLDLLMLCWCREVQLTGCSVDQAAAAAAAALSSTAGLTDFLSGMCWLMLSALESLAAAAAAATETAIAATETAIAASSMSNVCQVLAVKLASGTALLLLADWPPAEADPYTTHDVQAGLWRLSLQAVHESCRAAAVTAGQLGAAAAEVSAQLDDMVRQYKEVNAIGPL